MGSNRRNRQTRWLRALVVRRHCAQPRSCSPALGPAAAVGAAVCLRVGGGLVFEHGVSGGRSCEERSRLLAAIRLRRHVAFAGCAVGDRPARPRFRCGESLGGLVDTGCAAAWLEVFSFGHKKPAQGGLMVLTGRRSIGSVRLAQRGMWMEGRHNRPPRSSVAA